MSEFVECQNCGRTFFAENLDCPYCHGETVGPGPGAGAREASGGTLFGVLFAGFFVLVAVFAAMALAGLLREAAGVARLSLAIEAVLAVATLVGLWQRRRVGRRLAILFILVNSAFGIWSIVRRGEGGALAWGPGPAAMLLFLWPFLSPQARARYSR